MKLLKITSLYPEYARRFYADRPGLSACGHAEQKTALDYDAFGWADYWTHALRPLGYDVADVVTNAESLQRAWAREHVGRRAGSVGLSEIAVMQVKAFRPEILWFDHTDARLLRAIRREVASIRVVVGWTGSAIPETGAWQHVDLVLSCAPEAVEALRHRGCDARHLNHGFDPRILDRLGHGDKRYDFSFIGQVVRSEHFHNHRERLLELLAGRTEIAVFSSLMEVGLHARGKSLLLRRAYGVVERLRRRGVPERAIARIPILGRATKFASQPVEPVSGALHRCLNPAVFGLKMFQVLKDSRVSLNSHADSSPRFASNMRLFETTGVGTCMLTDAKSNLGELFAPDAEVVVYESIDECVEKVSWLLEHPAEREAIAMAGQARTLSDHTYAQRALVLDGMIHEFLGR